MPPKREAEPLAVILDCPIGHVAVVKGEGQYDAADKRFRYSAILYDQEGNRVFLPGRARNVLTINVLESGTNPLLTRGGRESTPRRGRGSVRRTKRPPTRRSRRRTPRRGRGSARRTKWPATRRSRGKNTPRRGTRSLCDKGPVHPTPRA